MSVSEVGAEFLQELVKELLLDDLIPTRPETLTFSCDFSDLGRSRETMCVFRDRGACRTLSEKIDNFRILPSNSQYSKSPCNDRNISDSVHAKDSYPSLGPGRKNMSRRQYSSHGPLSNREEVVSKERISEVINSFRQCLPTRLLQEISYFSDKTSCPFRD